MHQMPDEWQKKMAELLEEWEDTWDTEEVCGGTTVRLTDDRGKLIPTPDWVHNYRHPQQSEIDRYRRKDEENVED
jgi:hypothetical protein